MSEDERLLGALTGVVAVATLPLGILAGIFKGGEAAAVVFVVGWLLLVPVLGILEDHVDLGTETGTGKGTGSGAETAAGREPVATNDADDDALQRLRERYAAGEIDETEFERRLEALLETEDLDVPVGTGRRSVATDRERETESESE